MKLYLAGPMTGIAEHNFPAFKRAARALRNQGYEVVSPAEHDALVGSGHPWAFYLRRDIALLLGCDGVATLPGWGASRGACLEVHVATRLEMSVRPIHLWPQLTGR